jgi:hypothetical protein
MKTNEQGLQDFAEAINEIAAQLRTPVKTRP